MTDAAVMLTLADNVRLREALGQVIAWQDRGDGNAPGHAHIVPGIWDDDIGNRRAGKVGPCEWCAIWNRARAAMLERGG